MLMDFGAEYGGYNADLTRTIPVNGKFSRRQKQVYNACLHLHYICKESAETRCYQSMIIIYRWERKPILFFRKSDCLPNRM